jgi:hypothetical protein
MTLEQLEAIVKKEGSSFTVYVNPEDRWNSASVYVTRRWGDEGETDLLKLWKLNISHSSSSTSQKNVDAILHTGLMITQLQECIEIARFVMNNIGNVEAAYQEMKAAERAIYEAKRAAEQALIDADTQITTSQAAHLVASICVDIKHGGKYKIAKRLRHRGSTNMYARLVARRTDGGAVQFKLNNTVVPKSKLDALIANYAEICEPVVA